MLHCSVTGENDGNLSGDLQQSFGTESLLCAAVAAVYQSGRVLFGDPFVADGFSSVSPRVRRKPGLAAQWTRRVTRLWNSKKKSSAIWTHSTKWPGHKHTPKEEWDWALRLRCEEWTPFEEKRLRTAWDSSGRDSCWDVGSTFTESWHPSLHGC